jgi:hypothetical protein
LRRHTLKKMVMKKMNYYYYFHYSQYIYIYIYKTKQTQPQSTTTHSTKSKQSLCPITPKPPPLPGGIIRYGWYYKVTTEELLQWAEEKSLHKMRT